ncbi:ganglioside GM2 activator-like [Ruditapes philippinarum]|uniref:ganglioside GM2 activator-like n=1 Tax=Ruditapes philippinarum TaxID=129788 RepID=UPI00295A74DD|nr:ganglioside GM2 activator-like [Ruditapes philippinarum]
MLLIKTLLVVYLSRIIVAYTPFSLTDCAENRLVTLTGRLTQHPIEFPGDIRVTARVDINRPLTATGHLRLDAEIQKWIVFDYFTLPCISNVGSCSYDLCDLLSWFEDRGCPWQLEESNFPCTCPFSNGTYTLDPHPFSVPTLNSVWQWIAYGDFRVTGSLIDENTSEVVSCYVLEFSVQRAPIRWPWW